MAMGSREAGKSSGSAAWCSGALVLHITVIHDTAYILFIQASRTIICMYPYAEIGDLPSS